MDNNIKAIYIISYIGGTIAQYIQTYYTNNPSYFISLENVIQTLYNIIGDPYKKDNIYCDFKSLR